MLFFFLNNIFYNQEKKIEIFKINPKKNVLIPPGFNKTFRRSKTTWPTEKNNSRRRRKNTKTEFAKSSHQKHLKIYFIHNTQQNNFQKKKSVAAAAAAWAMI